MDGVDVVDRRKPTPLHGVTWRTLENAYLDELQRLYVDRKTALDALREFQAKHPRLAEDPDVMLAMLALQ